MNDDIEGKIDAEGEIELHPPFWKRLKEALSSPEISERLVRAVGRKRAIDWYDIRTYRLDDARNDELVTDFPRDGDCILVLSITSGASASIKYDSSVSDSFDLVEYRKLRHNFSNLFLTNAALGGATLQVLFGRGDWEVERHHPEEEIMAINADTVDGLHASASVEAGKLLALGADGFFPCGAVRCLQNEVIANLPAAPAVGDVFISRDTGEFYICFTAGAWTNILTPTANQIAFTPAGDIVATDVQAAIEELDAEKIADIADVIKDGHIDWGTGANQVSAADIPIADPGGIITATQVEGALQEIMVDLNGFPDELKNLVAAEINQLENIGPTTISADQFGFLGAIDAYSTYMNQHFTNLLDPWGGMESWSGGAAADPDGWTLAGAAATVAREAGTVRHGNYSAKLTRNGTDCVLYHDLEEVNYYKGRKVILGSWVWASVASRGRLQFNDGVSSAYSSYHPGDSTWKFLTMTVTVNAGATQIRSYCRVDTGDTDVYFDGLILVEGTICPTYMPAVKPVYLASPLLSGSYDGDSFSTGNTLIDTSAAFGAPPGIKAALVFLAIRDSGTPAGNVWGGVMNAGSATAMNQNLCIRIIGITADSIRSQTAWVTCDSNGDFYFNRWASGADTLDAWMKIWAYVL